MCRVIVLTDLRQSNPDRMVRKVGELRKMTGMRWIIPLAGAGPRPLSDDTCLCCINVAATARAKGYRSELAVDGPRAPEGPLS